MSREQELVLIRKIGLMGLKDLRKIAPIGDIGYLNDISFYRGNFFKSGLVDAVITAFYEQRRQHDWTVQEQASGRCIYDYYCPEICLRWSVDSSD